MILNITLAGNVTSFNGIYEVRNQLVTSNAEQPLPESRLAKTLSGNITNIIIYHTPIHRHWRIEGSNVGFSAWPHYVHGQLLS